MNVKKLKMLLQKYVNKVAFIALLVIASGFSILSFVPNLPFTVTYHAAFFTLIMAMGELYRISQKHIIWEKGVTVSDNFNDNVKSLVQTSRKNGKVSSIKAFANNFSTYRMAIESVLNDKTIVSAMQVLAYLPNDPDYDKSDLENNIVRFLNMKTDRKIENLEFRFYDFSPMFFFSIYSETYLHWGIFQKLKNYPWCKPHTDYAVFGRDKASDSLISEFNMYFRNIWENHSKKDDGFIEECRQKKSDANQG